MRLAQATAFALFLFTAAPVGSFAADPKSDVTAAYAAFDVNRRGVPTPIGELSY